MRALKFISLVLLVISMAACIYDAYRQNMFCVVWAVNVFLSYNNFKSSKS